MLQHYVLSIPLEMHKWVQIWWMACRRNHWSHHQWTESSNLLRPRLRIWRNASLEPAMLRPWKREIVGRWWTRSKELLNNMYLAIEDTCRDNYNGVSVGALKRMCWQCPDIGGGVGLYFNATLKQCLCSDSKRAPVKGQCPTLRCNNTQYQDLVNWRCVGMVCFFSVSQMFP